MRYRSCLAFFLGFALIACGCGQKQATIPAAPASPSGPSIRLFYPDGGERLHVAEPVAIAWTSSGLTGGVRIELSTDGGATWPRTIAASAADNGQYSWAPPEGASPRCRIRVRSLADTSVCGQSARDFGVFARWIPVRTGIQDDFRTVQFVDSLYGWIDGLAGIYQTTDGGRTWSTLVTENRWMQAVRFYDRSLGLRTNHTGVLRTTDGGASWTIVYHSAAGGVALSWPARENAILANESQGFLHTTDAGLTWRMKGPQSGPTGLRETSCVFLDDLTGWQCTNIDGNFGVISKTTDGGDTWTPQVGFLDGVIAWGTVTPTGALWFCGDAGNLWHTSDEGDNWQQFQLPAPGSLYSVSFASDSLGAAVGAAGAIHLTRDGGKSWLPQPSVAIHSLDGVFFLDRTHGWVVGEKGTLLLFNP